MQESLEYCTGWGRGPGLYLLGWLSYLEGDYVKALHLTGDSLSILRPLGSPQGLSQVLLIYALEHLALGDETTAQALLEELLTLGVKTEHLAHLLHALYGLGRLALYQGEHSKARAYFEDCVKKVNDTPWYTEKTPWIVASCLEGVGVIVLRQNQPAWATCLFAAADTQRRVLSVYVSVGIEHLEYEEVLSTARTALGETGFARAWEEGRALSPAQILDAIPSNLPLPRDAQ